jgi:formylglycine-generating enzyme required for sulfatase activity
MNNSEVLGKDRKDYCRQLFETGTVFPSLLNYSYNVLMSVDENGFLFTEGENTSIPIWILQDLMAIRQDVEVINMQLLDIINYRQRQSEKTGLKRLDAGFEEILKANPGKRVFLALTVPSENYASLEDQMYVTGLTSMLSNKPIDNYKLLRRNIEQKFLLDYLTVDFNAEPRASTGKSLETNYILPFFMMKQFHDRNRNLIQSAMWEKRIENIAGRSNIGARVHLLMSNSGDKIDFVKSEINVKELDKSMMKVKDNLYASNVELNNEKYESFLKYLKTNNYEALYEIAAFDLDKYEGVNRVFHTNYHFKNTNNKEDYSQYPVMDLSHEAARLYCEWLSYQYNQQEDRKFHKVKFRLPSGKEWTMAALGFRDFQTWTLEDNIVKALPESGSKYKDMQEYRIGDYDGIWYPWYHGGWNSLRKSITNEKGCYLANVKTADSVFCASGIKGDGYRLTSPVATYFSNDMGLYDVIGNVAEMTEEKGIAMGGSWNHPAEESTIVSINHYEGPDPSVGFRLFMEVIEE